MDFDLNPEQEKIRAAIREFVERECPDNFVRKWDEQDIFPMEVFEKLARPGFCGWTIPKEYGGPGRDVLTAIIIEEELTRQWAALGWIYCMATFFGGEYITELGSERQKQEFLSRIAKGELLFSLTLTEPNAGSDLGACQTFANEVGDEFILNGQKTFISGADITNYLLMLVRTSKSSSKAEAFSFFIIDTKAKGLTMHPLKKLGYKGSSCMEIFINDVKVSRGDILGEAHGFGKGWGQLLQTLNTEHAHVAADGVGIAQGAFDRAIGFAKRRTQFGKRIGELQGISNILAEIATEIQAARLLLYNSANLIQQNKPCYLESSIAKYYATEVAERAALAGMEIFGGCGYLMENEMQRYLRDSMATTTGGGTDIIQKEMIARRIGL